LKEKIIDSASPFTLMISQWSIVCVRSLSIVRKLKITEYHRAAPKTKTGKGMHGQSPFVFLSRHIEKDLSKNSIGCFHMTYLKNNAEATMIQRSLLIEYLADNESFKRTAKKPAAAQFCVKYNYQRR
jgi:hypothetical protein